MPTFELTEDQAYWVAVAIENGLESAKKNKVQAEYHGDVDDQLDAGLLINRYTDLQTIFPAPELRLQEDDE